MNDKSLIIENLIINDLSFYHENNLKFSRNSSNISMNMSNSKFEPDIVNFNASFIDKEIKKYGSQLTDRLNIEQISLLIDKLNEVLLFFIRIIYSTDHY